MSDRRFPFESAGRRELDRTRRDNAIEEPTPVGYQDTEDRVLPLAGDSTAPYSHAIGRASSDGTLGAVAVADGEPQRILTDELGRVYVTAPSGVAALEIQGNVENDLPDLTTKPVKVGGRAVANGAVGAAVAAADRVDGAYSLNGAAHTLGSPNPIADATTYAYSVIPATVGDATGRLVIKASAGRLRRVLIVNNDVATRYAMVFNSANLAGIVTGAMRTPGMPIPAGGFGFFDFSEADLACPTGIAVALSTTQTTYTAAAVTGQFSAQYA